MEALLRGAQVSISATNLAEVIDQLVRVRGHLLESVHHQIDMLMIGGLEVEPVWLRVIWLATSLRAENYRRATAALSMPDCVCIATAMVLGTDVATTDPALARVARDAGVAVVALPDSNGQRP